MKENNIKTTVQLRSIASVEGTVCIDPAQVSRADSDSESQFNLRNDVSSGF